MTLNKSNNKRGSNIKYLPYVFTEHGVMMISSLLKNDIAANVNVLIIKAFVEMKKIISNSIIDRNYIDKMVIRHDNEIKLLQESFNELSDKKEYDGIFFDGQVYDSYSLLIDIFNTAKKDIVIIDNYIDKKLLDILRNIDKNILIVTNNYNNEDYNKYISQYTNIKLKINNNIHDRFIIIDNNVLYHCGASFKDLGKKCFGINKIESKEWLNKILKLTIK